MGGVVHGGHHVDAGRGVVPVAVFHMEKEERRKQGKGRRGRGTRLTRSASGFFLSRGLTDEVHECIMHIVH